MPLAEFNLGILRHDWDDRRVADFVNGFGRVLAAAERADGFIWKMGEAEMDAAQRDRNGPLGRNLRLASTLSVWRDAAALDAFTFGTIHRRFYDRGPEWFLPGEAPRLVLWNVEEGHRPGIEEACERLEHLKQHGASDYAFGWRQCAGARNWHARHERTG